MKDKDEKFRSRNDETGMLEDIDEVRRVGVTLAGILQSILLSPILQLSMPPGLFLDVVTMVIQAETMLHTVSEADTLRLLSGLLGKGPLEVEAQIRLLGLSEKLPVTHPDAATHKVKTEPIAPNSPIVRDSEVLRGVYELQRREREKEEPRVELPPTLEAFLKEIEQGKYEQEDKQEGE